MRIISYRNHKFCTWKSLQKASIAIVAFRLKLLKKISCKTKRNKMPTINYVHRDKFELNIYIKDRHTWLSDNIQSHFTNRNNVINRCTLLIQKIFYLKNNILIMCMKLKILLNYEFFNIKQYYRRNIAFLVFRHYNEDINFAQVTLLCFLLRTYAIWINQTLFLK